MIFVLLEFTLKKSSFLCEPSCEPACHAVLILNSALKHTSPMFLCLNNINYMVSVLITWSNLLHSLLFTIPAFTLTTGSTWPPHNTWFSNLHVYYYLLVVIYGGFSLNGSLLYQIWCYGKDLVMYLL